MTCVVGLVDNGTVHMGVDSIGVTDDGSMYLILRDEKMFAVGPFLFGCCGNFRMRDLLRYSLSVAEPPASMSDDEFIRTTFVNAVRDCLKAGGMAVVENNVEEGGTFLVGYRGHLYLVEDSFQVVEPAVGYWAVGCGAEYALGALHASRRLAPRKRMREALEASERFSAKVRGPFHYATAP